MVRPQFLAQSLATLLTAAAAVMIPQGASAAGPEAIPPEFSRFRATPEHQAAVLEAARLQAEQIPGLCKAPTFAMTEQLFVYQPVQFTPDGKPTAGAWKEPLLATGCGAVTQFNVLTYVPLNNGPKSVALFPGDTRTDPLLARDAGREVFAALAPKAPDCKQPFVTNAKFGKADAAPAGKEAIPQPWTESWTVSACGKSFVAPIRFTPGADGITFAVDTAGIKQRGAATPAAAKTTEDKAGDKPKDEKPKQAKKKGATKDAAPPAQPSSAVQ